MNRMYGLDKIPGSDAPWTQEQENMARKFYETRDWLMDDALRFYHAMLNETSICELQEMQNFRQERMRSMETQLHELRKAGISERMLFERRERLCTGLKNGG